MVRIAQEVRRRFDRQVFKNPRDLATTIEHTRVEVQDSTDGGFTPGEETVTQKPNLKGVPYNNDTTNLFKTVFGEMNLASGTVVLRYDADVEADDLLSWSGKSYRVQDVRSYPINGQNVLLVAQVNEYTA